MHNKENDFFISLFPGFSSFSVKYIKSKSHTVRLNTEASYVGGGAQ